MLVFFVLKIVCSFAFHLLTSRYHSPSSSSLPQLFSSFYLSYFPVLFFALKTLLSTYSLLGLVVLLRLLPFLSSSHLFIFPILPFSSSLYKNSFLFALHLLSARSCTSSSLLFSYLLPFALLNLPHLSFPYYLFYVWRGRSSSSRRSTVHKSARHPFFLYS